MGGEALLLVSRLPSTLQVIGLARKICEAGLRTFAVLSLVVCDFFSLSLFFFFNWESSLKKNVFTKV